MLQFAIGSVLSIIFWTTGFVKPPKLDAKLVRCQQPLQLLETACLQYIAATTRLASSQPYSCASRSCAQDTTACSTVEAERGWLFWFCFATGRLVNVVAVVAAACASVPRFRPSTLWPSFTCWAMC